MKNLPLTLQIWLVFTSITLGITIVLSILFPLILRDFFTKEVYTVIESAQDLLFSRYSRDYNNDTVEGMFDDRKASQDFRTVGHFFIFNNETTIFLPSSFHYDFKLDVTTQAKNQVADSQRYSNRIDDRKIFYVISKSKILGNDVYIVSYLWDTYRNDLVQTLFSRLLMIMGIVFVFSWVPSLCLAKYLSNPLKMLEKRVRTLTLQQWNESIRLNRKDEIGKLGQSIEQLRIQLIQHDEGQRTFLQNISHELKTPVMVLRSYIQSIHDGVYPKGNLNDSLQIIDEEIRQLEKRIRNILYLTKLDYFKNRTIMYKEFDPAELIYEVYNRFYWVRKDLDWIINIESLKITGDPELWTVLLENLFDNQIRYAKSKIIINLSNKRQECVLLHVKNDGPSIEQETLNNLFRKFNKGHKGKFGLGLTVIHGILSLHNSDISVVNEDDGVSFYINIRSKK